MATVAVVSAVMRTRAMVRAGAVMRACVVMAVMMNTVIHAFAVTTAAGVCDGRGVATIGMASRFWCGPCAWLGPENTPVACASATGGLGVLEASFFRQTIRVDCAAFDLLAISRVARALQLVFKPECGNIA